MKQQTRKGTQGVAAGVAHISAKLEQKKVKPGRQSVYLSICLDECVFNKQVMINVSFCTILTASQGNDETNQHDLVRKK